MNKSRKEKESQTLVGSSKVDNFLRKHGSRPIWQSCNSNSTLRCKYGYKGSFQIKSDFVKQDCKKERKMHISNYLSYFISIVEMLFYAGVPYGFGFLQYIFEKEGVFWMELCYDETNPEHIENCKIEESEISCSKNLTERPCQK